MHMTQIDSTMAAGTVAPEGGDKESQGSVSEKAVAASLVPLLIIFMLGTLCLQGFNLVAVRVGADVQASGSQATLITALPAAALGIVCFIYGSLSDFVSLRKLMWWGIGILLAGSAGGFLFHGSLALVIIFRILQTVGYQAAGSVYMVLASRFLAPKKKVFYLGLYTAGYQVAAALGILSAGFLSEVQWSYLFLIPLASAAFIPVLARNIPKGDAGHTSVDVAGFGIIGAALTLLILFFSQLAWWMLGASAVFFAVFAVYIHYASAPFITPGFFHNIRWLKAISLIVVFYSVNFAAAPLYNAVGEKLYGITSATVSLLILPAFICAAVIATFSGSLINRWGSRACLIAAAVLMILGTGGYALTLRYGAAALSVTAVLFYTGMGLIFSPIYNNSLSTLPGSETGRGVGMNDLAMQGSAAVGVTILGGLISSVGAGAGSSHGKALAPAQAALLASGYSQILWIITGIEALGVVLVLVFSRAPGSRG